MHLNNLIKKQPKGSVARQILAYQGKRNSESMRNSILKNGISKARGSLEYSNIQEYEILNNRPSAGAITSDQTSDNQ